MTRTLLLLLISVVLMAPAAEDPVFPYGAVYFRKSNPPEEDWERDHRTAAQVGMNIMRHWFMWSAIEVEPGKYEWRDYDRMLELEAKNDIRVIIAEMITSAPEWAFDKYPHARFAGSDGHVVHSGISASSATGGFPGLCLDNEDVRAEAEKFLTALIEHYRDKPALMGYDLWNETTNHGGSPQRMYCYCEASQKKFREWLKKKYGTIGALGRAWHRYSYAAWDNVHPPREFSGYPESLDWLEFRIDNAYRLYQWRVDLFRRLDPLHKVTAHGVAGTLDTMPSSAHNEWRGAAPVDVWGFTWIASRKGSEPWKQFHAVDLVRAGARGKPFWHAEAQAGPLWMQPQVIGRPREDGRIAEENDVRLWNLISAACGATGILYPRWRPLLDGPLFGAFGPFGMDGSVTPRATMAGRVARWANSQAGMWKSRPVKGDVGIAVVPESEIFAYVQQGSTQHYTESARGAYQAFFDSNIQADWVHIDDIAEYPAVYLPYPVHLKAESARKLIGYVENGGRLISEGLPGYFGDRGHVGETQPNLGLDALFGAREKYVEFNPDLLERFTYRIMGSLIHGRFFLQEYELTGGQASGQYPSGGIAAVEHSHGKGKALLLGSFPGGGYFLHRALEARRFFAELLEWAGIRQRVRSSDPDITARLHDGAGGRYLWVINPTREARNVTITLDEGDTFRSAEDIWDTHVAKAQQNAVSLTVTGRNAAVLRLR
jgi:beta-galactosidase